MRRTAAVALVAALAGPTLALAIPPGRSPRVAITVEKDITTALTGPVAVSAATLIVTTSKGTVTTEKLKLYATKDGVASMPVARPAESFQVELWVDYKDPKHPAVAEREVYPAYFVCKTDTCQRAGYTDYLVAIGRASTFTEDKETFVEILHTDGGK